MKLRSDGHDIMAHIMSADIRCWVSGYAWYNINICLLSPGGKRWKTLTCHPMASLKHLPDIHWRLLGILLTSLCHVVTTFAVPPTLFSTFPIFPLIITLAFPTMVQSVPAMILPFPPHPPPFHHRYSFKLGWVIPQPKILCQTKKLARSCIRDVRRDVGNPNPNGWFWSMINSDSLIWIL